MVESVKNHLTQIQAYRRVTKNICQKQEIAPAQAFPWVFPKCLVTLSSKLWGETISPQLVGGWTTHLKNIRQIGSFPQGSGWKYKIFEPPPRQWSCFFSDMLNSTSVETWDFLPPSFDMITRLPPKAIHTLHTTFTWATRKHPLTFHHTGWLIGILIMVY